MLDKHEWQIVKTALANKNRSHITRDADTGAAKLSRKATLSSLGNHLVLRNSIFRIPIKSEKTQKRQRFLYLIQAGKQDQKPINGGMGRFKLAVSENELLYGIKRYHKKPNRSALDTYAMMQEEIAHLHMVGYEAYAFWGKNQKGEAKFYLITRYLGQSLFNLCSDITPLSFEYKLLLAAKLSLTLAKLHAGRLNNQQKPLIHYDLKPDNITVDEHGEPHLIDFGFADIPTAHTPGKSNHTTGYRPMNHASCSAYALDVFALKRTCYVPILGFVDPYDGYFPQVSMSYLFNDHDISAYPGLGVFLDTRTNQANEDSAIFMAARFTTWLLRNDIPTDVLYRDPILCWQLAESVEPLKPSDFANPNPAPPSPRPSGQWDHIPVLPSR